MKSYCNLLYHIVFSTKHREPTMLDDVRDRIHEYLGGSVKGLGGIPLAINGTEDHVHLLAKLRQDKAVSDVVRDVKAGTSGWIHRTFPQMRDFAWQAGYGAFTVSRSNVPQVTRYIAKQQEHHRRRSFQEEFLQLLERHGVEYDPRYLWD